MKGHRRRDLGGSWGQELPSRGVGDVSIHLEALRTPRFVNLYGGFITWARSIVNSISSPLPSPRMGVGLEVPSLSSWLSISEPSGSCLIRTNMLPSPSKPQGIAELCVGHWEQTHICPLGHSCVTTARREGAQRAGELGIEAVSISGRVLQTQTLIQSSREGSQKQRWGPPAGTVMKVWKLGWRSVGWMEAETGQRSEPGLQSSRGGLGQEQGSSSPRKAFMSFWCGWEWAQGGHPLPQQF